MKSGEGTRVGLSVYSSVIYGEQRPCLSELQPHHIKKLSFDAIIIINILRYCGLLFMYEMILIRGLIFYS